MYSRYDNWDIKGFDREKARVLCGSVNPLVAALLASRGITEIDDAKAFIDTENEPYYDPFLLTDMVKAVGRIKAAIDNGEFIAIYGDYDVDGMTSAALLALWLESKSAKYDIYIPGRSDEGYGLNTGALDTIKSWGAGLVITVDCGVTAADEALYAKQIGLGLIITDHHECRDSLPGAIAVIDPKRPDCAYPFKSLAGVGVVFKLICALEANNVGGDFFDLCGQLVALGTIADVMPVTGENRKLIRQGLASINRKPLPGLESLIKHACTEASEITATTISYTLAPRLNAAGRMADPLLSVRLLLSRTAGEAAQYVRQLGLLNDERQRLQQSIFESALEKLGPEPPDAPIVLADDGWFQGVTGIVAAKMSERFRLPAIIISIDEDGTGRGSCRSFGTFSLYDALCTSADILINYGGHEMAAGITIGRENIDELKERITQAYIAAQKRQEAAPGLAVDFEVTKPADLLTARNVEALECLKPFGRDNPPPCLCIKDVTVSNVFSVGSGRHTKIYIEKNGYSAQCIFFSVTAQDTGVCAGDTADIAFEPQINEFRGRKDVQLQLLDIKKK